MIDRIDLEIPGRGIDLRFGRTYNSKWATSSSTYGPFGWGWTHSYDIRLMNPPTSLPVPDGTKVTVCHATVRNDTYTFQSGTFQSPRGVFSVLLPTLSGSTVTGWVVRSPDGSELEFNASGRLVAVRDASDNAITFIYTGSDLTRIIDTYGRSLDLTIINSRITQITDFTGRKVIYTYGANNNLIEVQSPLVTSTATWNDFPTGRKERYEYRTAASPQDHLLEKIFSPNDVAQSLSATKTFSYSTWPNNPTGSYWCTSRSLDGATEQYSYDSSIAGVPLRTKVKSAAGLIHRMDFTPYGVPTETEVNTGGTGTATTTYVVDSENRVLEVTQPEGNKRVVTYDSGNVFRWARANVLTVTLHPKPSANPPQAISESFIWEPVFQHICKYTDPLGKSTDYLCDYMEGSVSAGTLALIAQELRTTETYLQGLGWAAMLSNSDMNGDGIIANRVHGKLIKVQHPDTTLPNIGSTPGQQGKEGDANQRAMWTSTWNGYGQVTSETDEEENVTAYVYYPANDPDGDGQAIANGQSTVTGGYLKQVAEDVSLPHSDLPGVAYRPAQSTDIGRNSKNTPQQFVNRRTDFTYNPAGSVSSILDPRGIKTLFHVNELDEVWMIVHADSCNAGRNGGFDPSTPETFLPTWSFKYGEMFMYDHNGNTVMRVYKNADVNPGDEDGGDFKHCWETSFEYDRQDRVVSISQELGSAAGDERTIAYGRDADGRLTGTSESSGNTVYVYDVRGNLVTIRQDDGGLNFTTTFEYTANGLLSKRSRGTGSTAGQVVYQYDAFDRLRSTINPIGSETNLEYDASSQVTRVLRRGKSGGPSPSNADPLANMGGNVDLNDARFSYDERGRVWRQDVIDPAGPLTVGALSTTAGWLTTRFDHDRLGRQTFVVQNDDKGYETQFDGVSRPIRTIDPLQNKVEIKYDDNDNPVKVTEIEQYPSAFTPSSRSYETFGVYDSLNRRVSITDNIGQTQYFAYDSRGNMTKSWDAKGSLVGGPVINGRQCNLPGNESRYWHDGASRRWKEEHNVTANAANDAVVRILQDWDDQDNLVSKTDDNGNMTAWTYDALGRQTREDFADGTYKTFSYDGGGMLAVVTDARNIQVSMGHDRAGRLTSIDSANGSSPYLISTHVNQTYEYNGLDLQTRSFKQDGPGTQDDWDVTRTFDAIGRLLTENQNGRVVTNEWREESKRTKLQYPSSGTYPAGLDVNYVHDALDRVAQVKTGSTRLAQYQFAGPGRLLQRVTWVAYPTIALNERHYDGATSNASDANYYDDARRPIKMETYDRSGTQLLSGFQHGFDRANMRTYERRIHHGNRGDRYKNDELSRLTTFERDLGPLDVDQPSGGTPAQGTKEWELDGVHNWFKLFTNGVSQNNPSNSVNEYTSFAGQSQAYDADGNLGGTWEGTNAVTLKYDALNRLRQVIGANGEIIEHDYDANGRRIRTSAVNVAGQPAYEEFYYDGWTVIEETSGGSTTVLRRFVNGSSIDEPLRLENNATVWGQVGTFFYQRTVLGSICAIADTNGAVVERYTYDAYGAPQFESANGTPIAVVQSQYGNPLLFQGMRQCVGVLSTYDYRARWYSPLCGRFLQRDPIGVWGDIANHGGAYAFVGGRPINGLDPLGLDQGWLESVMTGLASFGNAVSFGVAGKIGEWSAPLWGHSREDYQANFATMRAENPNAALVGDATGTAVGVAYGVGGAVQTGAGLMRAGLQSTAQSIRAGQGVIAAASQMTAAEVATLANGAAWVGTGGALAGVYGSYYWESRQMSPRPSREGTPGRGENAKARHGREMHNKYEEVLKTGASPGEVYTVNKKIPGTNLRPDAIDWLNSVVRELKSCNSEASGWSQVERYRRALEKLTRRPWKGFVDLYY